MKNIDLKTNTNDKSRATLLRKMANLPINNQLQVIKIAINYQFKNKDKLQEYSNAESLYIALIDSIQSYTSPSQFDRCDINNELKKLKKQEMIKVQRIKNRFKKPQRVKDKLTSKKYWLIVEKLRIVDKMSYKAIASYLLTYHKFKIDYSYIAKVWKEKQNG